MAMRWNLLWVPALFAAGCSSDVSSAMDAERQDVPNRICVRASISSATRTALGGERGVDLFWSAGDRIGVWGDASEVNRCFEMDDRCAGGVSADFTGESFASTRYYACYPYREKAVVDGAGAVELTLPQVQPFGGPGTFAAGSSPMVAQSSTLELLPFRSGCGVVRLQLTGTASVRSIRMETLGGEALCGEVRLSYDAAEDAWTLQRLGTESALMLDCSDEGIALSPDTPTQFCLVVPPGEYAGWRFTIADTSGGTMVRETSNKAITLEANHVKTYNPFEYEAAASSAEALDAVETANCYVVSHAGTFDFDATTMGNGRPTPAVAEYASTYGSAAGIDARRLEPVTAELLWQTAPGMITDVHLADGGRLSFTTSDPFVEGNAVVAVRDAAGKILWSWHLWFTAADLDATVQRYVLSESSLSMPDVEMMDRNLGALSATYDGTDNTRSYGMFYQWGRKDPFVPFRTSDQRLATYDAQGAELSFGTAVETSLTAGSGWHVVDGSRIGTAATIASSIRCPMNFITAANSGLACSNWLHVAAGALQPDDLWGCADPLFDGSDTGTKTIYDPCPPGYRVPHRFVWAVLAPTADSPLSKWYAESTVTSLYDGFVFHVGDMTCYYPATGCIAGTTGRSSYFGSGWTVWSNSADASDKYTAGAFVKSLSSRLLGGQNRSYGAQVRCMKEQ